MRKCGTEDEMDTSGHISLKFNSDRLEALKFHLKATPVTTEIITHSYRVQIVEGKYMYICLAELKK